MMPNVSGTTTASRDRTRWIASYHGRACAEPDAGYLREWHLRPVAASDEQPADGVRAVAKVPRVPHLHGIAFPPLHCSGDLFPSQRDTDHLLRIACGESITCQGIGVRPDVEIATAK